MIRNMASFKVQKGVFHAPCRSLPPKSLVFEGQCMIVAVFHIGKDYYITDSGIRFKTAQARGTAYVPVWENFGATPMPLTSAWTESDNFLNSNNLWRKISSDFSEGSGPHPVLFGTNTAKSL